MIIIACHRKNALLLLFKFNKLLQDHEPVLYIDLWLVHVVINE